MCSLSFAASGIGESKMLFEFDGTDFQRGGFDRIVFEGVSVIRFYSHKQLFDGRTPEIE